MHPDRFIVSCTSWDDSFERTKRLPTDGEKGAVFERLTQLYLQITPEYQAELQHVWTIRGARNAQGGEVGREGSRAVDRVRREVEDEARRVK
jgi:predicted helicase